MRPFLPLALVGAVLAGGCVKPKPQVEPEMPVLEPPPPPPRVIVSYEPEPEPEPAAEPEPVETPETQRPRPSRPARSDPASRPEPAPPPAARPATPPPSLTLKPSSGSEAKTEASIRDLLSRASRDLGRANYGALDPDGRTQYDTAKRFLEQAEEALKTRNYVFAGKLADKAATMAAVLVR